MSYMLDQGKIKLKLDVHRAVVVSLGFRIGTRYKQKLLFSQLVDDKIQGDNERFVAYVKLIGGIQKYLEQRYPFLNLDNLDLSWTGEQLEVSVLKAYDEWVEKIKPIIVKV